MSAIAQALLPILFLILLGYALKSYQFLTDNSWANLEKLVYFILFPALLIHTLGTRNFSGLPWLELGTIVVITLLLTTAFLALIQHYYPIHGPTFTSVFQGGVRFNTYITLAVSQSLLGQEGLILGSVISGFMIILVNILCIAAFILWGEARFKGFKPFIYQLLRNPLIIACLIGLSLNLSGLPLSGVHAETLAILSKAALPLGLLSVGAALQLGKLREHLSSIGVASLTQFIFKPLVVYLLILLMGVEGITISVLLITFSNPTAPSAYILSRQLGGDSDAMASIITLQTLLAFLVMPLVLWLGT